MIERLPKNCWPLLDNLAKAFGEKARLGFEIGCTSGGKNKFNLMIDLGRRDQCFYLSCGYSTITVPGIGGIFNHVYPDFILKKTKFMPLAKLTNEFKLDKELIAFEIMKRIRLVIKERLKYDDEGAFISLTQDSYVSYSNSRLSVESTPKFKSFSEFLVWADLNVK